jgi:hypothetical protein
VEQVVDNQDLLRLITSKLEDIERQLSTSTPEQLPALLAQLDHLASIAREVFVDLKQGGEIGAAHG